MLKPADIVIRTLHDLSELRACIELQRRVWGFADLDVVPEQVFAVAAKTGGQVLGACAGEKVVGFALSFSARTESRAYLHSHMVAVLPDYQNQGLGRLLKLAQRKEALACGLDLIEWTFDPFQTKNAYFNVARLGAIVRRYIPNCYGRTSSPLHGGLPTDRLVAEWWLQSARVKNAVSGSHRSRPFAGECISVPADFQETCRSSPADAEQIQLQVRRRFEAALARGRAVVGFEMDGDEGTYLMEPYED